MDLVFLSYGLHVAVEDVRLRIALIDRSNLRALQWIRDYLHLYERIEQGDPM